MQRRMNRRDFVAAATSAAFLAGGSPAWPDDARAQQNLPVIGLLNGAWSRVTNEVNRALRENSIQWNVEFSRWSGHRADQMAMSAAEPVKRQVAVIVAFSTTSALAAKTVTSTTPIIFLADDPVAAGLVDSLN